MKIDFKKNWLILVGVSVVFCAVFYIYARFDFLPTSTDSIRIMIGAKEIEGDGELHKNIYENGGYTPYEKETNYLYPEFQILIFMFTKLFGTSFHFAISFISILLCCLIFCSIYLLINRFVCRDLKITFLSSLILFFSLSFGRSILLTPQNLFGYLFIFLSIYFLLRFLENKNKIDLLVFFSMLLGLFHFHHLSFFVFLLVLASFLLIKLKWKSRLILLFCFILTFGSGLLFLRFVLNQAYLLSEFKNSIILAPGENANSFLDLPAQIGYVLFLLMALGIFELKKLKKDVSLFAIVFLITVFILSYLHYLGIYYFPDRMVLYFIIPAVFLVPPAFLKIREDVSKITFRVIIFLLFLAASVHFVFFLKSDVEQFTRTFIPSDEMIQAVDYLKGHSNENETVLSTSFSKNRSAIFLPYYYQGRVSLWLDNDLTVSPLLKEPKYSKSYLSKFFLKKEFQKPSDVELENNPTQHLYIMISAPKSQRAEELFKEYEITNVLLYKKTVPFDLYKKAGAEIVFENNEVAIFKP